MKRLTLPEFIAELKAQGVPRDDLTLVCPRCGTAQSMRDLRAAGVAADRVESFFGFSCVGRFTDAGPFKKGAAPGNGCDWTLGGLFRIHRLEVVTDDGTAYPLFEVASPEVAQRHAARSRPREFSCRDCGAPLFELLGPPEPPVCRLCAELPGWSGDADLRRLFGFIGSRQSAVGSESDRLPTADLPTAEGKP